MSKAKGRSVFRLVHWRAVFVVVMVVAVVLAASLAPPTLHARSGGLAKSLGKTISPEAKRRALAVLAKGWEGIKSFGRWLKDDFAPGYALGKVVDLAFVQSTRDDLKQQVVVVNNALGASSGVERDLYQEQLDALKAQVAFIDRLLAANHEEIRASLAALQREQEQLSQRFSAVEARLSRIEERLDQLDERLARIEQALIVECLDLQNAPLRGEEGYRISTRPNKQLADRFRSERATVDTTVHLDSCSYELTTRGLFLQLSLLTERMPENFALYATVKSVSSGRPENLTQLEYPLGKTEYDLDTRLFEIFLPYTEIPLSGPTNRFTFTLTLFHDGGLFYSLPDQVFTCNFGQRTQCQWVQ